ncbi:MAG TPA: hypothetical protein VIY48_05115 [Candidatus Paceibacterota bacterium]
MTQEEYVQAIIDLDKWFTSQGIEDSDAAIVMAQFVAHSFARNFDAEGMKKMTENFHVLVKAATSKYLDALEEVREAQRPN